MSGPMAQEAECTVSIDRRLDHRRASTLITQTLRPDGSLHLVIGAGSRYLIADIPEPAVSEMLEHASHIADSEGRTAYIEDWLNDNITRIREAHERAIGADSAASEFSFSIVPVRRVIGVPRHSLSGVPRLIQDRESIQALQARLGRLSRDGSLHLDTRAELASLDREIGRVLREYTNDAGEISQDGIRLLNGSVVRGQVHEPGILGRVHALIDGPDSLVERDRAVHRQAVGIMARLYELGSDASLSLAREIMNNLEDYSYGSETTTGAPGRAAMNPLFERAEALLSRTEEPAASVAEPAPRPQTRGRLDRASRPESRRVSEPATADVSEPVTLPPAAPVVRPPSRPRRVLEPVRSEDAEGVTQPRPAAAPVVRPAPVELTVPDGLHARDRPDEVTLTSELVPQLIALARERISLLEGFVARATGSEHQDERDYLRAQLRAMRSLSGTGGAGGSLRQAIDSSDMRRLATAIREADSLIHTIDSGLSRVVTRREEAASAAAAQADAERTRAAEASRERAEEEAAIRRRAGAPADWVIPRGYQARPWQVSRAYIDQVRQRDGDRASFRLSIEQAPPLLSFSGEYAASSAAHARARDFSNTFNTETANFRIILTFEDIRAACAAARPRVSFDASVADEDLIVLRDPARRGRIQAALVSRYAEIAREYLARGGTTPNAFITAHLRASLDTEVGALIDQVAAVHQMEEVRVSTGTATSFRPSISSGEGTEANPFVISIPVPARGDAGSELFRTRAIHPIVSGESGSRSVFFRLSFVRASSEEELHVSRSELIDSVSRMVRSRTARQLRLRAGQVPAPTAAVTQAIGDATAASSPDPIRQYIR